MEWSTTIFNDIHRLSAAHTLTWQAGQLNTQKLNIHSYWQLPRTRPIIFYKHPQEYVKHFSQLFEQAVSDRLQTNQIATHISGGMDSTSIAATAQKVLLERGKQIPALCRIGSAIASEQVRKEHFQGFLDGLRYDADHARVLFSGGGVLALED